MQVSFYFRGLDKPGVTVALLRSLKNYNVKILDLCQSRTEFMCWIYMMLSVSEVFALSLIRDATSAAKEHEFECEYKVDSSGGDTPPAVVVSSSFSLKILGSKPSFNPEMLCGIMEIFSRWEIRTVSVEHEPLILDDGEDLMIHSFLIKITLSERLISLITPLRLLWDCPEMVRFYLELQELVWLFDAQCLVYYSDELISRPKCRSLVVFGLNSTLVEEEVVDELLKCCGINPNEFDEETPLDAFVDTLQLEANPSRYQPLQRHAVFEKKLLALHGQDVDILKSTLRNLTLIKSAFLVCRGLIMLGYKLALMTTGFDFVANLVGSYLGIDLILANKLEVNEEGCLTGQLLGTSGLIEAKYLIDPLRKIDWLQLLRDKLSIPRKNIIVVADYRHADFLFTSCGMRIYFNAKLHGDLVRVLHMIGLTGRDILQLETRLRKRFGGLVGI